MLNKNSNLGRSTSSQYQPYNYNPSHIFGKKGQFSYQTGQKQLTPYEQAQARKKADQQKQDQLKQSSSPVTKYSKPQYGSNQKKGIQKQSSSESQIPDSTFSRAEEQEMNFEDQTYTSTTTTKSQIQDNVNHKQNLLQGNSYGIEDDTYNDREEEGEEDDYEQGEHHDHYEDEEEQQQMAYEEEEDYEEGDDGEEYENSNQNYQEEYEEDEGEEYEVEGEEEQQGYNDGEEEYDEEDGHNDETGREYYEENPILEEENEDDESPYNYNFRNKAKNPKDIENKLQEAKGFNDLDEKIDMNKIKKSSLYQKFLQTQNQPKAQPPSGLKPDKQTNPIKAKPDHLANYESNANTEAGFSSVAETTKRERGQQHKSYGFASEQQQGPMEQNFVVEKKGGEIMGNLKKDSTPRNASQGKKSKQQQEHSADGPKSRSISPGSGQYGIEGEKPKMKSHELERSPAFKRQDSSDGEDINHRQEQQQFEEEEQEQQQQEQELPYYKKRQLLKEKKKEIEKNQAQAKSTTSSAKTSQRKENHAYPSFAGNDFQGDRVDEDEEEEQQDKVPYYNEKPKKLNFRPEYDDQPSYSKHSSQENLSPYGSQGNRNSYQDGNNSGKNSNYQSSGRGRTYQDSRQNSQQSVKLDENQGNMTTNQPRVNKWDSYVTGDHNESMVNLNLNAQSNYVSVPQGQQFMNSNGQNNTNNGNVNGSFTQGSHNNNNNNPNMMPQGFNPFMFQQFMQMMGMGNQNGGSGGAQMQQQDYSETQDAFLLKTKLQEVNQNIQREVEGKKILEAKCQEYMNQLEKSAANFEEFKKKMFESNNQHQEEVTMLQQRINDLNDKFNDKEKELDEALDENVSLKRKLNYEASSKGKVQEEKEELQRRFDEINRTQRDKDGQFNQQDDEINRLKKMNESSRDEINYLKNLEEKLAKNLKETNQANCDLMDKNADLIKMNEEKDQELNMIRLELDNLRNQMGSSASQYRDLLSENEHLKKQALTQKEAQLETENELRNTSLENEKLLIELNQVKQALSRTESALERQRSMNNQAVLEGSPERPNNRKRSPPNYKKDRKYEPIQHSPPSKQQQHQDKYNDYRPMNNNVSATSSIETVNKSQQKQSRTDYQQYKPVPSSQQTTYDPSLNQQQPEPYDFDDRNPFPENPPTNSIRKQEKIPRSNDSTPKQEDGYVSKYEQQFNPKKKNAFQSNLNFNDNSTPEEDNRGNFRKGKNAVTSVNSSQDMNSNNSTPFQDKSNQHKFTTLNQVYKPTNNLLVWEEPEENVAPKGRNQEQRRQPSQGVVGSKNNAENQPTPPKPIPTDKFKKLVNEQEDDRQVSKSAPYSNSTNEPFYANQQPLAKESKHKIQDHITKENFGKEEHTSQNNAIKGLETNLMNLQIQRDNLNNELQRIDKTKHKSQAIIRQKKEVEADLGYINMNINNIKTKLRDLNALRPY